MQKRTTYNKNVQIANDTMYYIYEYIDTDINIDELALNFGISKFHLHKLFKDVMGINIYETIKSIRLQKASSLLLTNKYSTITQIASMCGYSSQTSFIRAFKERFNQTPKVWRNGGYEEYSTNILRNSNMAYYEKKDFENIEKNHKIKTSTNLLHKTKGIFKRRSYKSMAKTSSLGLYK